MKLRRNKLITPWWLSLEKQPTLMWSLSLLWLLLIGWLIFLWNLGSTGLIDETEPLFAEAARQMTVTGDWITPYFNGETRFDKPPLIYWLMAIGYKLIGVNEWAVRLPSALAAIALMIFGFYTLRYYGVSSPAARQTRRRGDAETRRRGDTETRRREILQRQLWLTAGMGSAMIALNPQTIIWARIGVSDMLLSSCMGTALLAFFLGYAQKEQQTTPKTHPPTSPSPHPPIPSSNWYLAFYFLIALAILAKGPVGIVLPGIIIGSFLLYLGKLREVLREMQIVRGILIIFALTLPWYGLVIAANGKAYIDSFFGYHNIQRFTEVVNGHSAPWYFYFLVVFVGFIPWSVYLPIAIARLRFWQRQRWQSSPRSTHLGLFALFWFAGIFGFFTIAVTKLPSYVLPLIPAAAIMVALLWSDIFLGRRQEAEPTPNPSKEGNRRQNPPLTPPRRGTGGRRQRARRQEAEGSPEEKILPPEDESSQFPIPNSQFPIPNSQFILTGIFNFLLLLTLAGAMLYSPELIGYDPAAPNLPEILQQSGLTLQGSLIWWLAAVVTALLLLKRHRWRWLWTTNFVGFVAFFILVLTPASFLLDEMRQQPLRELSQLAIEIQQPGEELFMIGFSKPSVTFYTQRPVNYFRFDEMAIPTMQQIAKTQPNPPSILILNRPGKLIENHLQTDEYDKLGSAGIYQLLRIDKQALLRW
ncbi:MAG: glycosyltransferase family 39 protein [Symploca sp. SIO2E6]|nr:glycosyltransferase family 39 protein [Symploca sp. SIO2E6]